MLRAISGRKVLRRGRQVKTGFKKDILIQVKREKNDEVTDLVLLKFNKAVPFL